MQYRYIRSAKLLYKISTEDHLFSGDYTLDPYKNCEFGCRYCDSSYEDMIYVKTNAVELFEKEIQNLEKGTIIIGSVHDPYQKIERDIGITREILRIIEKNNLGCHILTKSDLVLRDLDILSNIKNCKVTISILSLNENITKIFENNAPSSISRLEVVKKLREKDIDSGVALLPFLPFLIEDEIEDIIKKIKDYKAGYLISKYLELKGDQRNIFFNILKEYFPDLLPKYEDLYKENYTPEESYIKKINTQLISYCKKYEISFVY